MLIFRVPVPGLSTKQNSFWSRHATRSMFVVIDMPSTDVICQRCYALPDSSSDMSASLSEELRSEESSRAASAGLPLSLPK